MTATTNALPSQPRAPSGDARYRVGAPPATAVLRRVAQGILVALSLGGALALAAQIATWPDHPLADMTHVTWWTRSIQQHGVARVYSGTYPESYMIYPPGMAYAYRAAIFLAEHAPPFPGVAPEDWLRVCIKLVPIGAHGVLALALFGIVAAAGGFWRGWAAATLYAWSPGALFDAGYWGQGDTLNVALLTLAIGVLFALPAWWPLRRDRRWRWGAQAGALATGAVAGALVTAAGLTKPQSWVFLPLLLWVLMRRSGPLGTGAAAAAAAATAWLIVRPWAAAGTMDEMMTTFTNVTQVMPSVSANGHNLWWLKLPGIAISVFDTTPLGGFGSWEAPHLVTHATVGRLGFGLFALLPLLRLTGPLSLRLVFACAAYTAEAYFMTVTQVHENHMFAALPFLAAAAALDVWFALPLAVATACVFLNMALHDFLIGDHLTAAIMAWLPGRGPLDIQTANAMVNVAGFALFTLLLLRRPPERPQSAPSLRWRARTVMLGAAGLAGGALAALGAVLRDPDVADRLWQRMAAHALAAGPYEAKLGRKSGETELLMRAAADYANLLYTLAGVAAIVAAAGVAAGLWWSLAARYHRKQ